MIVLVCGGREFNNKSLLYSTLNAYRKMIDRIIHGGCRGADRLAGLYAFEQYIPCTVFKAHWDQFGKSAGFRRNQQMLDEGSPDLVIAFQGGMGTADMVSRAVKRGVEVKNVLET